MPTTSRVVTAMSKPDWINTYHGSYNRSSRNGAYKYIVVHYTGAQTPAAGNAKNNCIYFSGGNRNASAHYFIDNGGVWEYLDPDSWCAWHVGDGGGRYGITNSNGIGIEVCQQGDLPFTEQEIQHLTRLVAYLQDKYSVPDEQVVRHHDASSKLCPYYYSLRPSEWSRLHARITSGEQEEVVTDQDKRDIAAIVWNYGITGYNGTTVTAGTRLGNVSDDSDGVLHSGRFGDPVGVLVDDTDYAVVDRPMGLRARLDWTGAKVTELTEKVNRLEQKLDRILEAVAD